MKTIIFCEGITDIILIQFVLQYKYGWKYKGYDESRETNRLKSKVLSKDDHIIEINSCDGITNIPKAIHEFKDRFENATKEDELYTRIIVIIDHDTIDSNTEFITSVNEKTNTTFSDEDINKWCKWTLENMYLGSKEIDIFIKCVRESETGAIEKVLLEALKTDTVEEMLINMSNDFVEDVSCKQSRYVQKKSLKCKAVFNTYFSIREPEERHNDRSRVLSAYDWKTNQVLENSFSFLNIV